MQTLPRKVAAVPRAASGIGRAVAVLRARHGCEGAISDVQDAGLAETRALVEAIGVPVTSARLDVADRAAVHTWADRVAGDHGRVNVVVNNAGVALSALVDEMSYDDLAWLMDINFWGVVHGTKAFLPHLKRSGDGHVVNVSSVFGLIGVATQSAYNAAKFAVRGFTEALREELDLEACGVSCTSVHPGGIRTNIARSGRVGGLGMLARSRDELAVDFDRAARTTAEAAAEAIVTGIRRNRRRVLIGPDAYVIDGVQRLLPTGYQRLIASFVRRQRLRANGRSA
jgi:NAD(P)-dependent dehydrogenase (short-subunit alcohol dehydrogenase family)